jgi:hypothetical protein
LNFAALEAIVEQTSGLDINSLMWFDRDRDNFLFSFSNCFDIHSWEKNHELCISTQQLQADVFNRGTTTARLASSTIYLCAPSIH